MEEQPRQFVLTPKSSCGEIKSMRPLSTLTVLLAALSLPGLAADWSQYRGPSGPTAVPATVLAA